MKRLFQILVVMIFTASALGQTAKVQRMSAQVSKECNECHTCDVPTKENPCLVPCPRFKILPEYHLTEEGPGVVEIDVLSKQYGPVVFSHKAHAQMSEMSGGCYNCHHYNTAKPILNCKDCHSITRKREDISKPDLKGAYHQQCLNCHMQWNHKPDCNSCHQLKGVKSSSKEVKALNVDHPKVTPPEKVVYETRSDKGKFVSFFHNDHTKRFGLKCVDCHKQEGCMRCHDVNKIKKDNTKKVKVDLKLSEEQAHKPCFTCHSNDNCTKCHKDKPVEKFNHAVSTGWALNRFHQDLACQKCHGSEGKFVKLNNDCNSCHTFNSKTFNHKVTGLILNQTHSELDCGDCHIDRNFGVPPSCANCHDDKSFPKDKPGKMVAPVKMSSVKD